MMNKTPLTTKTTSNNNNDDNDWRRSHSRTGFGLWCKMVNSRRWFKLVVVVVVTDGYRHDDDEHDDDKDSSKHHQHQQQIHLLLLLLLQSSLWSLLFAFVFVVVCLFVCFLCLLRFAQGTKNTNTNTNIREVVKRFGLLCSPPVIRVTERKISFSPMTEISLISGNKQSHIRQQTSCTICEMLLLWWRRSVAMVLSDELK
jgi:hypothetical protein